MATIADVARLAGVSKSTVSHVVNGTRPVNPDTEAAVRNAMRMLAYTPNTIARSLARSRTNSVGVAIAALSNVYFGEIVAAIESECAAHGLTMLLADTHDDPDHELRMVQALHERRVDGMILAAAGGDRRTLDYLRERNVPTVLVDRAADASLDQVAVENTGAVRQLVQHLADHGHRRIGFLAGRAGLATTTERVDGFNRAVAELGLDDDRRLVVDGNSTQHDAERAVAQLCGLDDAPTAIVSGNNQMTIGTMLALRSLGRRAPDDVAVVGFDDFEWADVFEPRLTVIAQPCDAMGRQAVELLRRRLADGAATPITSRPAGHLVVRRSCGCP